MDRLYPDHCRALAVAGLLPNEIPTMYNVLQRRNARQNLETPSKSSKSCTQAKRKIFFCIGMSPVWKGKKSLSQVLKQLRNKHNLKWLRLSMSYHRFPNLREKLQGDLTVKLNKYLSSEDFTN